MNKTAVSELRLQLDTMVGQFAAVLPKHVPVERFGRVVLTAVQTNPDLLSVERRSLWNACMKAAQDGLMPDGRLGALVVYADKRRGKIAQWLPMIAGIRQKIRNSGEVVTFDAHVVHERDLFDYELGDNPHIVHRPGRADRGKIIAAYSIATLKGGEKSREVMWVDEIEEIRACSKAPDSPAWKNHYGEMCKKTVAKRHAKVLPMSTDIDDLLRRPDEPETGEADDARPPAVSDKPPPAALAETMMDQLTAVAVAARKDFDADDIDGETGEVIDAGEYAAGDDEQLPLEDQDKARHATERR